MLDSFHRMWGIVEEHRFTRELTALHKDPIRADEFVEGVKIPLSRKPTSGKKIGESVWFLGMALSSAVIYYRFDEERVYLLSIQVTPPDE